MTKHILTLSISCVCLWLACTLEKVDDPMGGCTNPPLAAFSPDKTSGSAPLTVSFDNNSSGANTYLWTFEPGQTSNLAEPMHTFSTTGTFTVSLIAFGMNGCSDTVTTQIQVASPHALFSVPSGLLYLDCGVQFNNFSTAAASYIWEFGDGSQSSEASPLHYYPDDGAYIVKLTAVNNALTDDTSFQINVYNGQKFDRVFSEPDDQYTRTAVQMADEGYIVLSVNYKNDSLGHSKLFKIDKLGNPIWQKEYEPGTTCFNMIRSANNRVIAVGSKWDQSISESKGYVFFADENGNKLHNGITLTYPSHFYEVKQLSDGNFIAVGYRYGSIGSDSTRNGLVLIFNESGNILLEKLIGTETDHEEFYTSVQLPDNSIIISGNKYNLLNPEYLLYFVKISVNGNLVWERSKDLLIGNLNPLYLSSIYSPDYGLVVTGTLGSPDNTMFLFGIDSEANTTLEKKIIPSIGFSLNYVTQMVKDNDQNLVIVGEIRMDSNSPRDILWAKLKPNGDIIWMKNYPTPTSSTSDSVRGIINTSDCGFLICGRTSDPVNGLEITLIKVDADGNY